MSPRSTCIPKFPQKRWVCFEVLQTLKTSQGMCCYDCSGELQEEVFQREECASEEQIPVFSPRVEDNERWEQVILLFSSPEALASVDQRLGMGRERIEVDGRAEDHKRGLLELR